MTGGRSSVNLKGYEHGYPKKGMLHLNNVLHRKFDMPAPPNDEKRRKDEIIEISSYLKMKKNIIDISKVSNHKDSERYFCAIFLCKKFSKKQIIGYVRKKCKEDTSEAMNTLRRRMGKDEIVEGRPLKRRKHAEDDEIVMDRTLNFKFSCPITCTRLRIPVKGYYCEHIECFDLENFIVMNNNFKSFKCPICSKKAVILHVDTINQKMIKVLPPETTQIKIKEDMVAYCNSGVQMDLEKLVEMINNNAPEEEIKANLVVKSTVPFDTETSDNSGSEEEKIPQKEKHVETVNLQNLSSNGTAGKEQLGKKIEDPLEKKNGEAVDEILGSNPPPIRDVFKPPRGRLNFNEPILLD